MKGNKNKIARENAHLTKNKLDVKDSLTSNSLLFLYHCIEKGLNQQPNNHDLLGSPVLVFEQRERDLNPRPLGYEPNELPSCSIPRVTSVRFELYVSALRGRYPFHQTKRRYKSGTCGVRTAHFRSEKPATQSNQSKVS